ncbi:unnamed protein product, partial [Musa hybrid cultivar]
SDRGPHKGGGDLDHHVPAHCSIHQGSPLLVVDRGELLRLARRRLRFRCRRLVQELCHDLHAGARHQRLPRLVHLLPGPPEHVGGVHPVHVPPRQRAEPVDLLQLAAGQLARVGLDLVDRRLQQPRLGGLFGLRRLRAEVAVHLRHPDRAAHSPGVVCHVRVEQPPHLLHQSPLHHAVHPLRHELVQHRQLHVHPQEAALVPPPELPTRPLDQLLDVRVRPPRHDGEPPPPRDRLHLQRRRPAEVRRAEVRVRRQPTEQVVGHPHTFLIGDFVGDDVKAIVHLHFVGVDDLAAEMDGHVDSEPGLAGARGAHHEHHLVFPTTALEGSHDEISCTRRSPPVTVNNTDDDTTTATVSRVLLSAHEGSTTKAK